MALASPPSTVEIEAHGVSKIYYSEDGHCHPKVELEIFLKRSSRTSHGDPSTPYTDLFPTYNRVHKIGRLGSFLQLTPQGAACMAASQQLLSQIDSSWRHHLEGVVAKLLQREVEKMRYYREQTVCLTKMVVQIDADVRHTHWSSSLKDRDDTCAVCLERFQESTKECVRISCSHQFHLDCVEQWTKDRKTCPVCRFELSCCTMFRTEV